MLHKDEDLNSTLRTHVKSQEKCYVLINSVLGRWRYLVLWGLMVK